MKVKELFPYLRVKGAAAAIEFYRRAFEAKERFRLTEPDGRIGHAELELGDFVVMLSEEYPEHDLRGPRSIGGTSVTLHLHVDDADAWIRRAVAAGAEVVRPASDAFYCERSGTPSGTHGSSATRSRR